MVSECVRPTVAIHSTSFQASLENKKLLGSLADPDPDVVARFNAIEEGLIEMTERPAIRYGVAAFVGPKGEARRVVRQLTR